MSYIRVLRKIGSLRAVALAVALSLGVFVCFHRLGVSTLTTDEVLYREVGLQYAHGDFAGNQQHPFLAKYLIGLAQLAFGAERIAVARLPSALAGFATGLVLLLFARRIAGYWAGLLCYLLWIALPHGINTAFGSPLVKIERLALLDSLMVFLMVVALYAGWRWIESTHWRWAVLAGIASGLAAAAKPPGILVLPGIVLCGVLIPYVRRRSWRAGAKGALQGAVAGLAAAVAAIATYAPMGRRIPETIGYMFAYQAQHGLGGHTVVVAGGIYQYPPWWSHLWWQWWNYGTAATLGMCVALGAYVFLRPRSQLAGFFAYAALGVVVPFVYLSFWVSFKLPGYYFAWQAPLTLLVAIAVARLLETGGWRRLAGLGVLVPFSWLAVTCVTSIATLGPSDYVAAAALLRAHDAASGSVVVYGYPGVLRTYLPEATVLSSYTARHGPVTAVIDDPARTRRFPAETAARHRATIARVRSQATHHRVDHLDVYVLNGVSRTSR